MGSDRTPRTTFTSREVCEVIGVSRRQVQHWDKTGLIKPATRTRGGHARYTFQDLISFKTAKKLLDAGVSLQRIRQSIIQLNRILPTVKRPLADLTLVTTGDIVLVFYEGAVFEAVSGQEWIVEVAEVQQAVEKWTRRIQGLKQYRNVHKGRKSAKPIDQAS
ncbi:MAG TPA: MerR family transcriptional regulator [Nitrospiria bacterium]